MVNNQTQYKKSLILENYNKLLDKCFLKPITQPFHNAIQVTLLTGFQTLLHNPQVNYSVSIQQLIDSALLEVASSLPVKDYLL